MSFLGKIFKDANEKYLEKISFLVDKINSLDKSSLNDSDFPLETEKLKERFNQGESLDDLLPETFALVREVAHRTLNQRHYDVQIIGGIALHQGKIAEMKTGEGKTLVATLPVSLNALSGKGVHVVTVNDYLARRDAVWMGQIYNMMGFSVSCINHEQSFLYNPNFKKEEQDSIRDELGGFKIVEDFLEPCSRKQAYNADITYGTNNEFGFDYLRDNMAYSLEHQNQRGFNYSVIDEVDSILIDEARTPLIISAPDTESSVMYKEIARIVPSLESGKDYEVFEKERTVSLTEQGIERVEKILGLENIYEEKGTRYLHYLEQALRAQAVVSSTNRNLFEKDRHYIVKNNQIIIIDESTGRQMPGRRWSGGLHQAIEAKENVFVQPESKTLASITFQNFFKMYTKISGMTGTAATSAEEFDKVYKLDVIIIPTNKTIARKDLHDLIFKTSEGKFRAIAREIKERYEKKQPVLVGTTSIEKNELLSQILEIEGVKHEKLNAKNHEREGQIIAQAGRLGAVTVATNMAGRGVDIILGGNPPDKEESQKVIDLGGLHVIGTERHEARRIDNQLRGRAGRQGDPGSSQFFVSLEDDLLRIFGGERIASMMNYLKIPEDQAIEASMVSGIIESAQGKIEGLHFDARKHLLDYDNVANKHREFIYKKRNEILTKNQEELKQFILNLIEKKNKSKQEFLEKEKEIGSDEMFQAVKITALRILDSLWVEHLYGMDELRDSVRLRAYGQKDPLIEYKNEGHQSFHEMIDLFEEKLSEIVFKLKLVESVPTKKVEFQRNKVGRNEPCPCGAKKEDGKPVKYKHCHGK